MTGIFCNFPHAGRNHAVMIKNICSSQYFSQKCREINVFTNLRYTIFSRDFFQVRGNFTSFSQKFREFDYHRHEIVFTEYFEKFK